METLKIIKMRSFEEYKGKIETRIWVRDRYRNVNPDNPPKETRELDSFLYANCGAKCFMKGQGGWYKITKEGGLSYVTRALYLLPLKDWLNIAKDDYFIPNI